MLHTKSIPITKSYDFSATQLTVAPIVYHSQWAGRRGRDDRAYSSDLVFHFCYSSPERSPVGKSF